MNVSPKRLRLLAAVAALLALPSCAGLSAKLPLVSKPLACPVEATAAIPLQPAVPDGAGFPQPITPAERAATGVYLEWLSALAGHDAALADRLTKIKAGCDKRDPSR